MFAQPNSVAEGAMTEKSFESAMRRLEEIVAELEGEQRGPYAGAVGYFSHSGNMDTCIGIRTIVMQGDVVHVQAGAGIVADSDPTKEYHETLHKAQALAEEESGLLNGALLT